MEPNAFAAWYGAIDLYAGLGRRNLRGQTLAVGANFYFNHFVYRYVAGLPSADSQASLSEVGGNPESPRGLASPPPGLESKVSGAGNGLLHSSSGANLQKGNKSTNNLAGKQTYKSAF